MKKALFLVAVATLALLSCQKENGTIDQPVNHGFTFKASIEAFSDDTKATLGSENALVWKGGDITDTDNQPDRIGIYVNDPTWTDKNQPFHLNSATDVEEGEFVYDYDNGVFTNENATAAFFPWEGAGSDKNNVYDGVAYFKLRDAYWSYDNNKMLTPLVASITYDNKAVNQPIKFKHAGAAVKLTLNNLPSGTYKVKMSVDNKQITGGFHVNPANAGTEALALDAAEDVTKNTVTLNTWKSDGAFNWIFPVPELTKPKLAFEIIDNNGVTVWSRSLKAQSKDVTRGKILAMPALDITPYSKFVQDDACTWSFSGNINGSAWQDNVPMMKDGKYWILAGCTFAVGDEFKIRKDKAWDEAYPSSNWKFTNETGAGAKDIIFNSETHEIKVVDHSCPYPVPFIPSPSISITIDGTMSDWDACTTESTNTSNNYRVFKATYDATNIYLYTKRVTVSGQKYIYYDFDTDNNSATGTAEGSRTGLEAFMALVLYDGTTIVTSPGADASYPDANVYSGVVCAGTYASDFTETEVSIPRSNLGINKGDIIKIYSWGNKSADGVASHPITLCIGN